MIWEDTKFRFMALKRNMIKSGLLNVFLNEVKEAIVRVSIEQIRRVYKMEPKEFIEIKYLAWYPNNLVNRLRGMVNLTSEEVWVCLQVLDDRGYLTAIFDEKIGFVLRLNEKLWQEYQHLL